MKTFKKSLLALTLAVCLLAAVGCGATPVTVPEGYSQPIGTKGLTLCYPSSYSMERLDLSSVASLKNGEGVQFILTRNDLNFNIVTSDGRAALDSVKAEDIQAQTQQEMDSAFPGYGIVVKTEEVKSLKFDKKAARHAGSSYTIMGVDYICDQYFGNGKKTNSVLTFTYKKSDIQALGILETILDTVRLV